MGGLQSSGGEQWQLQVCRFSAGVCTQLPTSSRPVVAQLAAHELALSLQCLLPDPPLPTTLPLHAAGVSVAFCFYLSVSVTGYSALGDRVPSLVLNGYTGATNQAHLHNMETSSGSACNRTRRLWL